MKRILKLLVLMIMPLSAQTRDVPDLFGPKEENYTLRLTVRVLTEEGEPLENADVHVAIENFNDFKDGSNDIRGKTDKAGKFSAEGVGRPVATIVVEHEGYYWSRKEYGNWEKFEEARNTGNYVPWDPVIDFTLRKIGKPIPMIVRLGGSDAIRTSPVPGKECGFDLYVGDWVAPHGKGKIPDMLITLALREENDVDGAVGAEIRFDNEEDGLVPIMEITVPESLLKYPRIAPANGFEVKVVKPPYIMPVSGAELAAEPVGYFFRIRTQKDKSTGKIVSAFYGKIVAQSGLRRPSDNPFLLHRNSYSNHGRKLEPGVEFSYYLNPTPNDRNLEYDQRSNLAPEATKGSVYAP